jgi:hypothetical protein
MLCNKCGKEIQDNINFCNYCGISQHKKAENFSNYTSSNNTSAPPTNTRKTPSSSNKELKLIGLITVSALIIVYITQAVGGETSEVKSSPVPSSVSEEIKKPYFRPGAAYLMDNSLGDDLRKQMGAGADEILRMDRQGVYSKYHAFIFNSSSGLVEGVADKNSRQLSDPQQGSYTFDYNNKTVQLNVGTGYTEGSQTLSFTHKADGTIIALVDDRGNTYRLQDANYSVASEQQDSYNSSQQSQYKGTPNRGEQEFEISSEGELMMYLDNRTYRGPNGIEIQFKSGNIYVNGQPTFFNLSYSIVSPSIAIVRGESTTNPDGVVKLTVYTKRRCISDSETTFCE